MFTGEHVHLNAEFVGETGKVYDGLFSACQNALWSERYMKVFGFLTHCDSQ